MLIEIIGKSAMLEQTAEECAELAQACLKMARKLRGENPTPKNMGEIINNLEEELADVYVCLGELKDNVYDSEDVDDWIEKKKNRMEERLKGVKVWKHQS